MLAPSFQTRVGRRIALMFVVGALLPVAALAAVGYLQVRSQLVSQAERRLDEAAKGAGMALLEQLVDGRALLDGAVPERWNRAFDSVVTGRAPNDASPTSLVIDGNRRVWIVMRDRAARAEVRGRLKPAYLFEALSEYTGGGDIACVIETRTGDTLYCSPDESRGGRQMYATWDVFLGYEYGSPNWQVRLAQPESDALAPIGGFRRTFIATIVLVLGLAVLLSSMQMRRVLGPLAALRRGTERLANRDFGGRVEVNSSDEFGDLATSFNVMTAELNEMVGRLDQLSYGALAALARTIDASSPWTAGHSERVTAFSLRMAERCGLADTEKDALRRGGLLHDIGKIGIGPRLLDKPGALTPEELREIQQHPSLGASILSPIAAFADAIPVVRHHHEWFDGTGYPDCLAGEAIPKLARLLSLADVYDALVSARPYRAGWPQETAIETIRLSSGTQFDPAFVDVFLAVIETEGDAARFTTAPSHRISRETAVESIS